MIGFVGWGGLGGRHREDHPAEHPLHQNVDPGEEAGKIGLPPPATPQLTRGNRKSQFHDCTGKSTSKVNFHHLSRNQWLKMPNSTARRRIEGCTPSAFRFGVRGLGDGSVGV